MYCIVLNYRVRFLKCQSKIFLISRVEATNQLNILDSITFKSDSHTRLYDYVCFVYMFTCHSFDEWVLLIFKEGSGWLNELGS